MTDNDKLTSLNFARSLYASRNFEAYKKKVKEMESVFDNTAHKTFWDWFKNGIHKVPLIWTSINRPSNFGSWSSTSLLERKWKDLNEWNPRMTKFKTVLESIANTLLSFDKETTLKQPKIFYEEKKKVKLGYESFKDSKLLINNEEEMIIHCISSDNENELYIISLKYLDCSCPSFEYSGRPCKHVYGGIFLLLEKNKVHLIFKIGKS